MAKKSSEQQAVEVQPKEKYKKEPLGLPMRLIMVLIVLDVLTVLLALSVFNAHTYLSPDTWALLINLILQVVSFWLIFRRMEHTREIVIGLAIFSILVSVTAGIVLEEETVGDQIPSIIEHLVLILFFVFSKKAKTVFTRPWNNATYEEDLQGEKKFFRPTKWSFWRNVVIYLCVFSIVGHGMELCMCSLIRMGLVPGTYDPNSMTWTAISNPFLTYGIAFVLIALVLSPFKVLLQSKLKNPVVTYAASFLFNMGICAVAELIIGLLTNQPVNGVRPYWDYSTMPFNFMGQICLLYSLFFGLLSSLMTWFVYPFLETQFARVPHDVMNVIFVAVVFFFALMSMIYYVSIPGMEPVTEEINQEILVEEELAEPSSSSNNAAIEISIDQNGVQVNTYENDSSSTSSSSTTSVSSSSAS